MPATKYVNSRNFFLSLFLLGKQKLARSAKESNRSEHYLRPRVRIEGVSGMVYDAIRVHT